MEGTVELSTEFDDLHDAGTADHDDIDFDLSTPRDQPAVSDLELPADLDPPNDLDLPTDPEPQGYQRGRIPSIVITEPSFVNLESLGNSDHQIDDDDDDSDDNDLERQTYAVVDEPEAKTDVETSEIVQEQTENLEDIDIKFENEPEKLISHNMDKDLSTGTVESEDLRQLEITEKTDMAVVANKVEDVAVIDDIVKDVGRLDEKAGIKQEEDVSDMITHLHDTEPDKDDVNNDGDDDEMAEEIDVTVSLDNIMVKDKSDDDSDSEFDFDLPTPTSLTSMVKPVQQDSAVKPAQTGSQDKPSEPENNVPAAASHDLLAGTPTSQQSSINSQKPGPNTGSNSPQASVSGIQKPVAVIKPTSQPAQAPYVVPPPPDEGTQHMLESAQAEWDKVTTVQAGYKETAVNVKGAEPTVVETVEPMTSQELQQLIKQEDFSQVRAGIKPVVERHGLSAFVSFLFGPPKLHRDLTDERDRVFCVALTQFNNDNSAHIRTLQTIYRCLTGSKFDCPRIGSHWEEIGFQGTDPATDLRGAGVLGLINLLHILKDGKKRQLASDIYRLSLHPSQNFPFCIMGINLTKITLQILREGLLNKECNRRHEVVGVVNDFYAGLYLQLYQVWKGQGKTISDSGFVIKDIETRAKKSPRDVFKNLDEYLNKKTVVIAEKSLDIGGDNFVNVCDDGK